jgi:von Willebrand factor type A domain-containing protein
VAGPCSSSRCVVDEVQPGQGNVPTLSYTRLPPGDEQNCFDDDECSGAAECRIMLGECILPPLTFQDLPDGAFLNLAAPGATERITPVCAVQGDCAGLPGTNCEQVGICQDRANLCTASLACPPGSGACQGVPSVCVNQTKCEAADYAVPDVPISSGAQRGALVASLRARQPNGLTPTGPALEGALQQARAWAGDNPGRQVVTVLATDGFPTECAPVDIPDIAALASDAASGIDGVKTFVIGVFSDLDLGQDGQARLNALAQAGGTGEAFVVNTTRANVADEFLNALNVIRTTAVGCEFRLDADTALDLDKVNLKVTAAGTERQLFNVPSAADCGAGAQAWYYVRDDNGDPLQINVCPAVCAGFMSGSVRVDLEIGCATLIR